MKEKLLKKIERNYKILVPIFYNGLTLIKKPLLKIMKKRNIN